MPGPDRLGGLLAIAGSTQTLDFSTLRPRGAPIRPVAARVVSVADLLKNGGR